MAAGSRVSDMIKPTLRALTSAGNRAVWFQLHSTHSSSFGGLPSEPAFVRRPSFFLGLLLSRALLDIYICWILQPGQNHVLGVCVTVLGPQEPSPTSPSSGADTKAQESSCFVREGRRKPHVSGAPLWCLFREQPPLCCPLRGESRSQGLLRDGCAPG